MKNIPYTVSEECLNVTCIKQITDKGKNLETFKSVKFSGFLKT